MKSKKFDIMPVYAELTIILTDDIVEARQQVGEKWDLPVTADLGGVAALHTADYDICPGRHWVFLKNDADLCRVSHELLHCVEHVDSWYEINSNEYRAYLLGYLVEEVWNWISKERV